MDIYTVCLYKRDKADVLGIPVLDTTVKSGDVPFAPTWNMVLNWKESDKQVDAQAAYTIEYESLMYLSRRANPKRWKEVIMMDKVALACYCHAGQFCHRLLLVEIFKKLGEKNNIPVVYHGELT